MMRFDRFTEKAQEAAMRAYEILQRYKHTQVDTEHISWRCSSRTVAPCQRS